MISIAQVRPNGILCYPEFEARYRGGKFHKRIGDVDDQKKRRFRKYCSLLLFLTNVKVNELPDGRVMKWRLNFLTITLPSQPLQGDNLTKAVALFFQKLRNHGFKHYVWRKELQKQRHKVFGDYCLHWHIVGCKWVDMHDLNKWWNESLKVHCPVMMKRVLKKFKTYYPPSTDVRAVCSIRGAMRDLEKYFQKAGAVTGNTFGVSHQLAQIKFVSIEANDTSIERCITIGKRLDSEWSSFYVLPFWLMLRTMTGPIKSELQTWKTSNTLD